MAVTTEPLDRAEPAVAAACAKAGLVWVTAEGRGPQPVWHRWHGDAVVLVVGGGEQPDPVPTGVGVVDVEVPSKDTRGRLVRFQATVERLGPVHRDWEAVVFALKGGRLNAPDAKNLLDRWASTSGILRLRQRGPATVGPARSVAAGTDPDDGSDSGSHGAPGHVDDLGPVVEPSGAVPLRPSPATTVTWHPFHVGGRATRRRSR